MSIQRLLERTIDVRIAEDVYGPAGARRFTYAPTYALRGLQALHLELDADG